MGKLDGKVAIVTGGARGLGRAYAKRLAGLGAKIAVADLNLRSYEEFEAEAKDMTADSTVAEIEAAAGTALGIEIDVRDHEAVEAMVARVIQEWGRVDILVANAGGGRGRPMDTKGQHPRSGALAACHRDEPVRDRLFVRRRRSGHETTAVRKDYHGKLSRRDRTFRGRRVRALWGSEGSYRPLHTVSGAGSRTIRHYGELHSPRRNRHRADHGDGYSWQRAEQS
jgi:hypothetical protein